MNLHLLALETSSSLCDVALLSRVNGTVHVYAVSHDAAGEHAERLLPMVDQALGQAGISRADLAAVAFGQGPGGFTGLRVACGVAQGMAFGLGLPLIPVPSLLAVAARAQHDLGPSASADVCHVVVQDARMGEVYLAAYQPPPQDGDGAWRTFQAPILIDAEHVQQWLQHVGLGAALGTGSQILMSGDALDVWPALGMPGQGGPEVRRGKALRADASAVAGLALAAFERGETVSPDRAAPLYVRDKVAYTTSERQKGAGGNPRAPGFAVTIQGMESDHLDAVAAIENRVQSFPWTRRNFADGLAAGYSAWVACQSGRVTGFYMAMMAPDVAHLLVIGVDPDFQGKGTGKMLLHHCEEQARQRGLDTVVLEVRFSNHSAIGFYQHLGFESFAVRKDYYPAPHGTREDACVMKKTLSLSNRVKT